MFSLNQFVSLLNSLATAHEQIHSFGEGDVWEIGSSSPVQYPLLWVVPQPSSTAQKILNMKFSLIFADVLDPDKSNEQDILSDTLQMALDILAQLNNPDYADDFVLDPNAVLTPFTEKFDDDVAGWKADVNIKVNYLSDRCAVPSALQPTGSTPNCAPVIVENSDGSYSVSFDAGSTATIPDSMITDSDGSQVSLPATKPFMAKTLTELIGSASVATLYNDIVAAEKIQGLVEILSGDDLINLSSSQIALLGSAQVQELTNTQIAMLASSQVQALTLTQIGYMSSGQVQELVHSQLGNLSVSQLQYILASVLNNQFLQDNLSLAQRNAMNEIYALPTGQTTSYASGDDGDLKHGRLADFFTLKTNNIFGNTHRFTDENGNQTYSSNYVIDHATGLGWYRVVQSAVNWTTAIAATLSLSIGGNTFNDFRIPNASEVLSIMVYSQICLNYSPFNINPGAAAQLWSSTTNYSSTTAALRISYQTFPAASSIPKTASQPYLTCRIHF